MILLDSNVVIYSIQPDASALRDYLDGMTFQVSIISRVEALGYHSLERAEKHALNELFADTPILNLTSAIVDRAIRLRQRQSVSLGDSLIAATALVHGLTLVTRNIEDFDWIESLELINPYDSFS